MGNFSTDFLDKVFGDILKGKRLKNGQDPDKLAIALVDRLKADLGGAYPDAQFRCEIEGLRVLIIGDASEAEYDGLVIEYAITPQGEFNFIKSTKV